MAYPAYIREKARQLRTERKLTLDEIAERLAIGKTTIWYWIKDLPAPDNIRKGDNPKLAAARRKAARANSEKHAVLRAAAYREGRREFEELARDSSFRDFVCMYIGEGYKRSRNDVSICNSNPAVMRLADYWIRRFTENKIGYAFQYHEDQDPDYLVRFWSFGLGLDPSLVKAQRKVNSGRLRGRTWRSRWGVLTVRVGDTQLRARLEAWMDCVKEQWLDSTLPGV